MFHRPNGMTDCVWFKPEKDQCWRHPEIAESHAHLLSTVGANIRITGILPPYSCAAGLSCGEWTAIRRLVARHLMHYGFAKTGRLRCCGECVLRGPSFEAVRRI